MHGRQPALLKPGGKHGILRFAMWRRSILVGSAVSEEGPKNPLKGITVKPLVPASYAQFGVGAEWKVTVILPLLADVGRSSMARRSRPSICGDLFMCAGVLPLWYFRPVYDSGYEPAMRCKPAKMP